MQPAGWPCRRRATGSAGRMVTPRHPAGRQAQEIGSQIGGFGCGIAAPRTVANNSAITARRVYAARPGSGSAGRGRAGRRRARRRGREACRPRPLPRPLLWHSRPSWRRRHPVQRDRPERIDPLRTACPCREEVDGPDEVRPSRTPDARRHDEVAGDGGLGQRAAFPFRLAWLASRTRACGGACRAARSSHRTIASRRRPRRLQRRTSRTPIRQALPVRIRSSAVNSAGSWK
jgi:hypothetical protein